MGGGLSLPGRQPFSFSGTHVFLTGGANGIGLALAKLLLKRGASLTLIDIVNPSAALKQLENLKAENHLPGKVMFTKADVSKFDQMLAAVKAAEEQLGPIDCLVPNAGVASGGLFLDERIEDLEKVTRVNFMGVIYTLKAVLPGMVDRGQGCVLMMCSMMAMFAAFCASAYAAPKAGVLALANALRLELIGTGVDITVCMPAFTDTAMVSIGLENPRSPAIAKQMTREMKLYSPDVVAELALQGVERGLFFAKSPDFSSNLAIGSMAGVAPRVFNEVVEFLLMPVYFFIHVSVRRSLQARISKWRQEEAAKREAARKEGKGTVETEPVRAKAY